MEKIKSQNLTKAEIKYENFCGADIFVSTDNEDEFIVEDDGITY